MVNLSAQPVEDCVISIAGNNLKILIVPNIIGWIVGTIAQEIVRWNPQYECQIISSSLISKFPSRFSGLSRGFDLVHNLLPGGFEEIREILGDESAYVATVHHVIDWENIRGVALGDSVMVISTEWRDFIEARGVSRSKIFLVPIGVDVKRFSPTLPHEKQTIKKQLGIPNEAFVVGSFGQQSPYLLGRKGPDIFIEAMKLLARKVSHLAILIVGFGWHNVVKKLREQSIYIEYIPYTDAESLPKLYGALDCYWITSRIEGGPVTLLESMSSGVPVVTTPVGMAKDVVIDGENAIMVPMGNAKAFCEKTLALINSKKLRNKIVNLGRKTVVESFQWGRLAQSIPPLYEKALANQSWRVSGKVSESERQRIFEGLRYDARINREEEMLWISYVRRAGDWVRANKMQLRLWRKYPFRVSPPNPLAGFLNSLRYNENLRKIMRKSHI